MDKGFAGKVRGALGSAAAVSSYLKYCWSKTRQLAGIAAPRNSNDIRRLYDSRYYLTDCGGYESYNLTGGKLLEDRRLAAVASLARLGEGSRILDLGCGRGELVYYFASAGARVVGVDYSESAITLAERCFGGEPELRRQVELICGDVCSVPFEGAFGVVIASDLIEHLGVDEVQRLYQRVSGILGKQGIFVIHTFPNLWYYKYHYPRIRRLALRSGKYLPPQPRTAYELRMHINEQSPRTMLRQLRSCFDHVLLWFGDPENPLGNLGSSPSKEFVRSARSLWALASHEPVGIDRIKSILEMPELPAPDAARIRIRYCGDELHLRVNAEFHVQVELENLSSTWIQSLPPMPVHLSYHWIDELGSIKVFDGKRTALAPPLAPDSRRRYLMLVSAPEVPGRWTLRLTLVQEGVRWFDEQPVSLRADVAAEVSI
jgi:SAM-dependent methyltransferase